MVMVEEMIVKEFKVNPVYRRWFTVMSVVIVISNLPPTDSQACGRKAGDRGSRCSCSSSASLCAAIGRYDGKWKADVTQRRGLVAGENLLIAVGVHDQGSTCGSNKMLLEAQLRQDMRMLAIQDSLQDPGPTPSCVQCASFTWTDTTSGVYHALILLYNVEGEESLQLEFAFDDFVHVGNASSSASLTMEHVAMEGGSVRMHINVRSEVRDRFLLTVFFTDMSSLAQWTGMAMIQVKAVEQSEIMRIRAPAGRHFLVLATLCQLSLHPLIDDRESLATASCARVCSLEENGSAIDDVAHHAPPAAFPAPHPEDVLCSLQLYVTPLQPRAGWPFTMSAVALGLVSGCRYKVVTSVRLRQNNNAAFEESKTVNGSNMPATLNFSVASCWPGDIVVRVMLYDDSAMQSQDSVLSIISRHFLSVAPCEVSYAWSSSKQPLFLGSMPYGQSPLAGNVRVSECQQEEELSLTLATFATLETASQLINSAAQWHQEMAVAFYARSASEHADILALVQQQLGPWFERRNKSLEATVLTSCPDPRSKDKPLDCPTNMLRKIACSIAKSNMVLNADVDMLASDELADHIRKARGDGWMGRGELLVIPSFRSAGSWPRAVKTHFDSHQLTVKPAAITMEDLKAALLRCELLLPLLGCGMWSPSTRWSENAVFHAPTEYGRWMEAEEVYEVDYLLGYEPSFVVDRRAWVGGQGAGMYDDRFEQGGWDKASVTFEAAYLGYTFKVLPKGFLVGSSPSSARQTSKALSLPLPASKDTGSVAADPHGQWLMERIVNNVWTDTQRKVAIRSCVVKAFKDTNCDVERLRLVPSEEMERVGGGHELKVELFGLPRSVGLLLSVYRPTNKVDREALAFHLLLPQDEPEEPRRVVITLGKLAAGSQVLRIELRDLQASKLMQNHVGAILAAQEHRFLLHA
ncbi:hypothetical protein GUITHDRAFT_140108 [Guillardia theta CCMP2712]|uniref:Uncharacterized protein n=1 Tax=Guillardia theta (strain CCMP2712) TaxID=905079 RepID=L1J791_GUITC|nr:hypothetical protein GUITHDRAFT_140108 [Guillardia theta CCMP2712]EKX43969.1 hypothetical protein GUITHDRAFT_140108 [Guillardia theta CCMP2712]|eukprot:XP_005830949.1 hypothetical protein GUITHDRAFT_140108 [Guillardia theta CCMP2712]